MTVNLGLSPAGLAELQASQMTLALTDAQNDREGVPVALGTTTRMSYEAGGVRIACGPRGALQPKEAERLSRQCRAILDRLRTGPAANSELAKLALKYTSRISDLRAAGYDVRLVSHDRESGLCVYELRA